ncbi:hypothetical protein [Leptothoe spongobia]|uniref:Uncharacterized protein n=1 Tax=Leptothoe spongobia TAU-MAC 1115 TaxID=1967444 RepID=A0A947DF96_9CYAN|nr:hypothetical protein [Leptothoe spongobia]MBT9315589.1 hypothetical protein [Leptothoe spongobia TAU-MAC 1115]
MGDLKFSQVFSNDQVKGGKLSWFKTQFQRMDSLMCALAKRANGLSFSNWLRHAR